MSISEQVKELRKWANCVHLTGHNYEILNQAADTIEALSAKQENAYYVKRNGKDDVIVSIMYNKADNKYHFVNLSKNHICACGFETTEEAIADMEQRKNNGSICDFYLIERPAEDCGGGWIYCGDGNNLPEPGRRYRVTALWKDGDFETRSVYDLVYGTDGLWHGENYTPVSFEIIAWKPLEEPYRENIEEHVRKSILGVAQMSDKAWAAYRKEQRTLRRSKRR